MSELIRAFISTELPEECKVQMKDFQLKLKSPDYVGIKWVAPESMHITLKFLGDIYFKDVAAIDNSIEDSMITVNPFTLKIAGTGFFPHARNIRVFWLGLIGDIDKLVVLQSSIENSLLKLGFPRETRPFSAHLTLARFTETCSIKDKSTLADKVQKIGFKSDIPIEVGSVRLMRSQLTPRGAIYTSLSEHKLRRP